MSSGRRSFATRCLHGVALAVVVGGAWTVQPSASAQLLPELPLPPLFPPPPPEPPPPEQPPPEQPPPPEPPPEQPPPEPVPPPQPPPEQPPPEQPPPEQPPPQQPPPPSRPPGGPPADSPSPTATRFEEDAPDVGTTGTWSRRGPEIAIFSDGAAMSADVGGSTVTLLFSGTRVSWIGLKCSICGVATVSIDGGPATTVDTAGSAAPGSPGLASEPVFTAANLADDLHALRITVTGTSSSGGAHIIVDAFDVTKTAGRSGGGDEPGGGGATDALWLSLLGLLALAVRRARHR